MRANSSGAVTRASKAVPVANRWIVDAGADDGSSGTSAASASETPAIASRERPITAPGPKMIASPRRANPTIRIANPTASAVGSPGSARRLIVFWAGSYPGVTSPAMRTMGTATTGAPRPRAAITRLTGQR